MKRLRRILVAIADLQNTHSEVLRRAAVLARATGAQVELFHAVTTPFVESRRVGRRLMALQLTAADSLILAQKNLEQIARSKLLQGCRVRVVAIADKPAHEAIVRRALAMHADLIINGTHTRGLADRLVLRHTDWELVRHSPVPLLLVKSTRRRGKTVVLAAIDPLHANAKLVRLDGEILDVASGMSAVLKGTLHVVHAYLPLSVMLSAGIGEPLVWNTTELDGNYTQRVRREFTRALRSSQIPPRRRHLRVGVAATELAACAARIRATLVVMGAISRSRLERLFVGSTAEHVLNDLACDVLIVKSPERKSPGTSRKMSGDSSETVSGIEP
jgi:universal stress protein E